MMKNPLRVVALTVVQAALLMPLSVLAQSLDEEKRGVIKELISVTQADRQLQSLGENAQMQAKQEAPYILERALVENKTLNEKQKQAVADKLKKGVVQKLVDNSGKMFVSDAFRNDAINAYYDVYNKNYSTQELKDLVTFYKSQTGQKYLATQGRVDQEIINVVMQKYVPQSRKAAQETSEKEIAAASK